MQKYVLKNRNQVRIEFIAYGGIVTNIFAPDRAGTLGDVVLGYDDAADFKKHSNPGYLNALIGRYANRIAKGEFQIDGERYRLAKNDGNNHLHGGIKGYDKVDWKVEELVPEQSYRLSYLSKDGEEGYPGNVKIDVIYSLSDKNEWSIDYTATTDKATHVNLTQHVYFNLSGKPGTTMLDHEMMIDSDRFTDTDLEWIPSGVIAKADGPYDFRKPKVIGTHIESVREGYNQNYILNQGREVKAELYHPDSGRFVQVLTTEPGLQFYSGYFTQTGLVAKSGIKYPRYAGLCLEAQKYPDTPNRPQFPKSLLRPGETYRQTTVYRFGAR